MISLQKTTGSKGRLALDAFVRRSANAQGITKKIEGGQLLKTQGESSVVHLSVLDQQRQKVKKLPSLRLGHDTKKKKQETQVFRGFPSR